VRLEVHEVQLCSNRTTVWIATCGAFTIYTFYLSNIHKVIKQDIRLARHVAHTVETWNAHRSSAEKPQMKRPLGRPKQSWKDNINIILRELEMREWTGFNWLRIDQWWAFVNMVMNIQGPCNQEISWSGEWPISLLMKCLLYEVSALLMPQKHLCPHKTMFKQSKRHWVPKL
jgi:hypothetical protein